MVRLIVEELQRTKKLSYLLTMAKMKEQVRKWNESEDSEIHGAMHFESTKTHQIVFMMFETEEEAALFKLTHL